MANILKRAQGVASVAGTVIYTVPVASVITIIGCRGSNKSDENQVLHITVNGGYVSGKQTLIPINSALDIMVGSKIVAEAGDIIMAYSGNNDAVDVHLSFLLQS